MADHPNNSPETNQDGKIFSDILKEKPLDSLQIEEPEFDSFDVQSAIQEAKTVRKAKPAGKSIFGKRNKKLFKPENDEEVNEETFFASKADRQNDTASEYQSVSSALIAAQQPAEEEPAELSLEEAEAIVLEETPAEPAEPVNPEEPETKEAAEATESKTSEAATENKAESTPQPAEAVEPEPEPEEVFKPRTFSEILHSTQYQNNRKAIREMDTAPLLTGDKTLEDFQKSPAVYDHPNEMPKVEAPKGDEEIIYETDKNERIVQAPKPQPAAEEEPEPAAEDEDDAIFDPEASLVDDYRYDEYEDKKHFSTTDYKKIEEYLANESAQGFHYARNDGNKYYFVKAKPHTYTYRVLYFAKEPDEAYWQALEEDGWIRVNRAPSRHKRDAGWYIVRNETSAGELPKEIDNEEEKYRYFSKLSKSCRSTMFLLFIVMVCSAISIWLQMQFRGYLAVIIASAVLFFIALWIFLVYARMLSKARKQASLLSARIRLAENDPEYQALRHGAESDEDLDREWNDVGKHSDEDDEDE